MEIKYYAQLADSPYMAAVTDLINRYSDAFVPPLTARQSTTDKQLTAGGPAQTDAQTYADSLRPQAILVAVDDTDKLVGIMSYREHYTLPVGAGPVVTYVSTIIVDAAGRGHNLTAAMYRRLFTVAQTATVATRTWSTNHAHLHILHTLNFDLLATLTDDRGPGVDTVYYGREINGKN